MASMKSGYNFMQPAEMPFGSIRVPANKLACRAFTFLEILAAISVIAILAVLLLPNYGSLIAKAQQAKCMANMRSIHGGLSNYLNDHENIWPQGPGPEAGREWSRFWITTLEAEGIPARTWRCPTLEGLLGTGQSAPYEETSMSYLPSMFTATPGIARRWPRQPWLLERADAHGNGALICFTDGSIKSFYQVLAEEGLR
jgi:prepilin-type N-terminal cleavage/methylation domain-containing protein